MAWRREPRRGTRYEVSTNTRDPSLQLVFGDPYGTLTQLGISVPSAIPTFYTKTPWANRYLFLLASARFTYGQIGRVVGMRQRVDIGQIAHNTEPPSNIPVYTSQVTPDWHFTDGNISWHLRRVPLEQVYTANAFNGPELMFRRSDTPALLFENAPAQPGGYAPPDGGQPPGNVVIPEFGNFHDFRFPWLDDHAWESLDIEVRGPCAIQLFASVKQTNPATRPTPGTAWTSAQLAVLPPEEAFLQAFPNAVYTRIAGSLIFEQESMYPESLAICQDEEIARRKRGRDLIEEILGPATFTTPDAKESM